MALERGGLVAVWGCLTPVPDDLVDTFPPPDGFVAPVVPDVEPELVEPLEEDLLDVPEVLLPPELEEALPDDPPECPDPVL
jgi:hypothetical protein